MKASLSRTLQITFVVALVAAVAGMASTAHENLVRQGIATGFGFLLDPTGWDVSSSFLPQSAADRYAWTFIVGLSNTIVLSLVCIVLATAAGLCLALLGAGESRILHACTRLYIWTFRNIPIIVQVFFWYHVTRQLPPVRQALEFLGCCYASNRGIYIPRVGIDATALAVGAVLVAAGLAAAVCRWLSRRRLARAQARLPHAAAAGIVLAVAALTAAATLHFEITPPRLQGFNFVGGVYLSPEFMALVVAIVAYNIAFVAEIINSGHPVGTAQPGGGGAHDRIVRSAHVLEDHRAASHTRCRPAAGQSVHFAHQEHVARDRNRLYGPVLSRRHRDQPYRAGNRYHRRADAGLPLYQRRDLRTRQRLQPVDHGARRTMSRYAGVPAARAAPRAGLAGWLRGHLLATPIDAALAIVLLALAVYALPKAAALGGHRQRGAGRHAERLRRCHGRMLGGRLPSCAHHSVRLYPYAEQWRAGLALAVVGLALAATFVLGARRLRRVVALWVATALVFVALEGGGVMGLPVVPTDAWGGLPLSIFVFIASVLFGFPFAIVLALGRGSRLPAFRIACTGAIEIVRAMPILTILFCAAIVIPLMLPDWLTPGKIYRVIAAMAFFYACFQAEIIRGGLQGVPVGQVHAALSLGMTPLQTKMRVELPQALRFTMPATINQIVVALKDTSMLLVVGIFDFLASANTAISRDEWARYFAELYQFVAVVFLVLTSVLAGLERRFVGNLSWLARRVTPKRRRRSSGSRGSTSGTTIFTRCATSISR